MLTRQEALNWGHQCLQNAQINDPRRESRLLLAAVLKTSIADIFAYPEHAITDQNTRLFQNYIERRQNFEPISRIIGQREFWGLDFQISSATLDPRPDSETLIEAVLDTIVDHNRHLTILDLGTGSGCLLLSLLHMLPNAHGVGIDQSSQSIDIARNNAHKLNLHNRVQLMTQNWSIPMDQKFDWVISNPPYIKSDDINTLSPDVRNFDPRSALDGGHDGLDCYRQLTQIIKNVLRSDGHVALEIGQDQQIQVETIMKNYFIPLKWYEDLNQILRCGVFQPQP